MKQSRLMSLVESVANVIIGYGVPVVTQILIFPIFGLHTTLEQNLQLGAVFTVVSIARSFALRRLFERSGTDALLAALQSRREQLPGKHARRVPMFVKIAPDLDEAQVQVIARSLHPYEMPAIHAVTFEQADAAYAAWIAENGAGYAGP